MADKTPAIETPPAEVAPAAPAPEPQAAAPATPAPEPVANSDDEFANAFSSFSIDEPASATPEPPAAPEPAAAATPEPPAAPEPVAAAPEQPAAPAADPKEVDAIIKRIGEVVGAQKPPEPAPEPAPAAAPEQPVYTPEEQATISKFQEDWPDVAQALPLIQRQFGREVVGYVFNEIGSVVRELKATVDALAYRAHADDLHQSVGDYTDQEREEIVAWADKQPPYLQQAYKNVIQQGTADEVADLVSRYREVTGKQPAPRVPAPAAASPGGSELSEPAKQAAAALAPVGSKRSVVQQPDDKSDFDGAFAKFSESFGT